MSSGQLESILRWVARFWAVASLLLLSAFVFGDAERSGPGPTTAQWVGIAFFPIGISVGMLVAFWKELWGGGMTILSLAGFYVWHFAESGRLNCGPWFVVFAAPGFLFLLAGLLHWQHSSAGHADELRPIGGGRVVG